MVISRGESILLCHPVFVQTRYKLVNVLHIKNGIRLNITVINGTYAEAMAADPLLGIGLEYLISMTSGGVEGGHLKNLSGSIFTTPIITLNISIMSRLLQ